MAAATTVATTAVTADRTVRHSRPSPVARVACMPDGATTIRRPAQDVSTAEADRSSRPRQPSPPSRLTKGRSWTESSRATARRSARSSIARVRASFGPVTASSRDLHEAEDAAQEAFVIAYGSPRDVAAGRDVRGVADADRGSDRAPPGPAPEAGHVDRAGRPGWRRGRGPRRRRRSGRGHAPGGARRRDPGRPREARRAVPGDRLAAVLRGADAGRDRGRDRAPHPDREDPPPPRAAPAADEPRRTDGMTGFHGTGPDEEAAADAMGRELDAVASKSPMMPTPDFTDRVMAAVAAEPPPRPVAAFGAAVMAVSLRRTLTAVGDAWRVALSGRGRPRSGPRRWPSCSSLRSARSASGRRPSRARPPCSRPRHRSRRRRPYRRPSPRRLTACRRRRA